MIDLKWPYPCGLFRTHVVWALDIKWQSIWKHESWLMPLSAMLILLSSESRGCPRRATAWGSNVGQTAVYNLLVVNTGSLVQTEVTIGWVMTVLESKAGLYYSYSALYPWSVRFPATTPQPLGVPLFIGTAGLVWRKPDFLQGAKNWELMYQKRSHIPVGERKMDMHRDKSWKI